ncbi:SDR family oxidoreductase [Caulobacter sp. S45]|uniref:SDR family oxidoreductase n=1 Tax=Caulobacter sp. S45 TaxID=1641861 RepID=UPI00131A8417|nr:SDR family oxidoreductase [Caulobacter sp. S45]
MQRTALVVGSTGIVGSNLARRLLEQGWKVHGLARRPQTDLPGLQPLAADLTDAEGVKAPLTGLDPTHVFFATWLRQPTEAENCRVNGAMVRNLLQALPRGGALEHVALVTGLKHYLGPFESYGKGKDLITPFRESMPRLPIDNFYYAQEDEVFAASAERGFSWSIHRPHTIIGFALGNAMNMGVTLAVYASICRETGRPFVFPGSAVQWNGLTDMTDARLLARQLEWAATSPNARNQAFNIVDGDVFRWKWMWSELARYFGLEPADFPAEPAPLETQMAGDAAVWADIAAKHGLVEPDISRLVSAWHTDADLGRPLEVVTDMSKSREAGFLDHQATDKAFFELFDALKAARVIPA